LGIKQLKVTVQVLNYLQQYDWPGNVRELEHVVNRASLKATARLPSKKVVNIEIEDCGSLINLKNTEAALISGSDSHHQATFKETVNLRVATEQFQRQLIIQILAKESGNWAATARRLSMDRANLNRIAKRLQIEVLKTVQ
jgi:anaerobic nitric oxide reductase transcription regulator